MKHQRLTRARRKEQTRERLLDAARTLFLEKGLASTSVEDIVDAAGYTRGAFYSNFRSKQDLLTELLRRDGEQERANLQSMIEDGSTPEEARARAIAYYSGDYLAGDSFSLWIEAQMLARRDKALREHVRGFRREKLVQIGAHMRTLLADRDSALHLQADELAIGLMSLCHGIRLLRMCNPQPLRDQAMQRVLAEFLSCLLSEDRGKALIEDQPDR